jgi:hypothetical protein
MVGNGIGELIGRLVKLGVKSGVSQNNQHQMEVWQII